MNKLRKYYSYRIDRAFRQFLQILLILKTKDQFDVTCYFNLTSYTLNMFRTLIYPSSGTYDYYVELPHWSCVLGSMCVGVSVHHWCFSLQHGYNCNTATPKLQHTSNQEQYDQCGNSTE